VTYCSERKHIKNRIERKVKGFKKIAMVDNFLQIYVKMGTRNFVVTALAAFRKISMN
jgi:hypothetical protein